MQTYDITIQWSINNQLWRNDDRFLKKLEFHNPSTKLQQQNRWR